MKINLVKPALISLAIGGSACAVAGSIEGGNKESHWQIYGWQNYSIELVEVETSATTKRNFDRISANAANIGFSASVDTGAKVGGEALKANFQCEQFTFSNRFTGTGLCNRNSKLSLSGAFGEFMVGQWLLPHNEMVAQWVDPFYDAGADSHSSIMGSYGFGSAFYNGGFGESFNTTYDTGFNRRQEEIVQYWSPTWDGFHFRIATTARASGDSLGAQGVELDPRIWSMGLAYENELNNGDNIWFAMTYQSHDQWAALAGIGSDSNDASARIAARYIINQDNGSFTKFSVMWETLELDWQGFTRDTFASATFDSFFTAAGNLKFDRDAWLVSAVHNFGNGYDVRFSYMNADDFNCQTAQCISQNTGASALNLGVYYTFPAGTEVRVTYSKVDNDENAQYDFGINSAGIGQGQAGQIIALGLVQWF